MSKEAKARMLSGMTLFEVMLSLALLVFIAGGVLFVMRGSLETAFRVSELRRHDRVTGAFFVFVKDSLRDLPVQSRLTAAISDGKCSVQVMEPGEAFAFGRPDDAVQVVLETVKEGNRMLIRLVRQPRRLEPGEEPQPLVLLQDVEKLAWRFYDPRTGSWQEDWGDGSFRPSLVELTLVRTGDLPWIEKIPVAPTPAQRASGERQNAAP